MPVLTISDPETGTSQKVELEDNLMAPLMGRRIGEIIEGTVANLAGYRLQLTGGTDKDGIPMRPDVHGGVKARIVLSGGVGYKPKKKGERKRVVVRGNTVSADTIFLNFKIVEKPKSRKKKREKPKPKAEPEPEDESEA
ncbi:MAG: 30S ribosomal protein S6e [Candidatus Bathyarchaeota archaeon]|nr:MAG: 30S ribosomal protein S6e [Candidatus Bathyarchaeota archaeon]